MFLLFLIIVVSLFLFPDKTVGFPAVHPIDADCFGYKYQKIDEKGINRVYCYGIMYNYWLE